MYVGSRPSNQYLTFRKITNPTRQILIFTHFCKFSVTGKFKSAILDILLFSMGGGGGGGLLKHPSSVAELSICFSSNIKRDTGRNAIE
jgi:hypothetical protein